VSRASTSTRHRTCRNSTCQLTTSTCPVDLQQETCRWTKRLKGTKRYCKVYKLCPPPPLLRVKRSQRLFTTQFYPVKNVNGPATRHGGAWRKRRHSNYLATRKGGGEWSASRPGRNLPPVPIVQVAGWAPEPVWTQRLEEKSSASVGDRTPAVQSVGRHCTD
jgi:hypothetical protein